MPWQFWLMVLGIVVMLIGGVWVPKDREGTSLALLLAGLAVSIIGGIMLPNSPMSRADNARATIAAATAAVARGTEEAELRNLERQAESAATAAAKGAGR